MSLLLHPLSFSVNRTLPKRHMLENQAAECICPTFEFGFVITGSGYAQSGQIWFKLMLLDCTNNQGKPCFHPHLIIHQIRAMAHLATVVVDLDSEYKAPETSKMAHVAPGQGVLPFVAKRNQILVVRCINDNSLDTRDNGLPCIDEQNEIVRIVRNPCTVLVYRTARLIPELLTHEWMRELVQIPAVHPSE
jgi:hypothetical protein